MPDILLMTYKFLFDDSDREDVDYSDEENPIKKILMKKVVLNK